MRDVACIGLMFIRFVGRVCAVCRRRIGMKAHGAVTTGYDVCPGLTTMQGCWAAANRAQAALAVVEDRLPRRAL